MIKKNIYNLFTFYLVCSSYSYAGFVSVSTGYDFFATEEMSSHNAQAVGPGFQVEIGGNTRSLIASISLKKSNLKGKVLNDDEEFSLSHELTSLAFKASFMVTKKNYGIVGFAINKHRSKFSNTSDYNRAALFKSYNLRSSEDSDGMFFGLGRNFTKGRNYSFYGEYLLQGLSSGPKGKNHSLIFGLRYKVSLNI